MDTGTTGSMIFSIFFYPFIFIILRIFATEVAFDLLLDVQQRIIKF